MCARRGADAAVREPACGGHAENAGNTPSCRTIRKQRIWRQKYELRDGRCYLTEGLYDGTGRTISETHSDENTGLDFIPVYVIINDGLTGDMTGKSDVERLWDNQDD